MNLTDKLTLGQKVPLLSDNLGEIKQELLTFVNISRISVGDALVTARRIVEHVVNGILERESFEHSHELIKNIETLGGSARDPKYIGKRRGSDPVLPPQIYSGLHSLRVYGNSVTHPFIAGTTNRKEVTVNQRDIDVALAELLRIIEWFFIEYSKGPQISQLYDYSVDPSMLNKFLRTKGFRQVVKEYVVVDGKEELQETELIPDVYAVEYTFEDQYDDDKYVDDEDENQEDYEWKDTEDSSKDNLPKVPRQGLLTTLRSDVPRMIILGPPGIGKSTTIRFLVHQDALRYIESPTQAKLPIFVELKNYTPGQTLDSLISRAMPIGEKLHPMLEYGGVALYLDGLNEVIDPNLFNHLVNEIKRLIISYTSIDIFITCRPKGYGNFFQLPVFNIRPLSDAQIQEYLLKNYDSPEKSEKFFESLQQNAKLKRICENPFILKMMVSVVKEKGQIPDNTGQLVRCFMRNLCDREAEQKNATFDAKVFRLLISHLAYATRTAQQQVFSENDAIKYIEEKRLRLRVDEGGLPFLMLACDMNILEQSSENYYSFTHELFQEYYAAETLAELASQDNSLIDELINNSHWGETVVLCAGIMENREHFIRLIAAKNSQRAAECLTSSTRSEIILKNDILEKSLFDAKGLDFKTSINGLLALIELKSFNDAINVLYKINNTRYRNNIIENLVQYSNEQDLFELVINLQNKSDKISDYILFNISNRVANDCTIDCKDIFGLFYHYKPKYCAIIYCTRYFEIPFDVNNILDKLLEAKGDDDQRYLMLIYNKFEEQIKYLPLILIEKLVRNGCNQALITAAKIAISYNIKSENLIKALVESNVEGHTIKLSELFEKSAKNSTSIDIVKIVEKLINHGGGASLLKAVDLVFRNKLDSKFSKHFLVKSLLINNGGNCIVKAKQLIVKFKLFDKYPAEYIVERMINKGTKKTLLEAVKTIEHFDLYSTYPPKKIIDCLLNEGSKGSKSAAKKLMIKFRLFDVSWK